MNGNYRGGRKAKTGSIKQRFLKTKQIITGNSKPYVGKKGITKQMTYSEHRSICDIR